jgi:uncharacterized protein (TIGR02001 family)
MKKKPLVCGGVLLALTVPLCAPAAAEDGFSLSANVGVASQYRFRGLMQTNNKPAVQGGFDIAHSSGFYIGNWNSNVSWLSDASSDVSAPVEMDFYGGYKMELYRGLNLDAGVFQYYYPGDYPGGFTSPDTTELYLGLGYGPVTFKYSHAVTNLFGTADSKNSQYYDLSGRFPTNWWGLDVTAHVGYQRVRNLDDGSYADWSLGVVKNWDKGFTTSIAYVDTNADKNVYTNSRGRYMGKETVVLSVGKTF